MTTEETKPVEREAFEEWAITNLPKIIGPVDWPMWWECWQASAAAALERAAQLVETRGAARRDMYDLIGDGHAAEIRALKGSRR